MELAKKLIEKGAIRQNTEIEAYFNANGLSCLCNNRLVGRFKISSAKISKDKNYVIFESQSEDNKKYRFTNEDVLLLDGMLPEKIAVVYDLNIDGNDIKMGKRRGRKPKSQSV